jgi:hypothetical protein
MHAASKLMMTFALIAGPMLAHAQVIADEEAGANATPQLPVDVTPPVDVYGHSATDANGNKIHMFLAPNSKGGKALAADNAASIGIPAVTPPLTYHGGPIMPNPGIYAIYWAPSTLQDGSATTMPAAYISLNNRALRDYGQHGLGDNNTQYYQTLPTKWIGNAAHFVAYTTDTNPYPASGCTDTGTPYTATNCITGAQMQTEIQNVIAAKGWPASGINNIYFLYTSSGELSCFDSTSTACAYTYYCAYHTATGAPLIYAIEPFGGSLCWTGIPSPNNNVPADSAITTSAHELTEAITDPEPNSGWVNSANNEIGDLCAWNFGTNTWDSGKANEEWNGHFYEIQQMWDNHTGACIQVGP